MPLLCCRDGGEGSAGGLGRVTGPAMVHGRGACSAAAETSSAGRGAGHIPGLVPSELRRAATRL